MAEPRLCVPLDPLKSGGGGRTRTYDLRIMRCTFGGAATWIQSVVVGPTKSPDSGWNIVVWLISGNASGNAREIDRADGIDVRRLKLWKSILGQIVSTSTARIIWKIGARVRFTPTFSVKSRTSSSDKFLWAQ